MTDDIKRVSRGVPQGGEFAVNARAENDELEPDKPLSEDDLDLVIRSAPRGASFFRKQVEEMRGRGIEPVADYENDVLWVPISMETLEHKESKCRHCGREVIVRSNGRYVTHVGNDGTLVRGCRAATFPFTEDGPGWDDSIPRSQKAAI